MDKYFLKWLHELTILGYESDITIPTELEDEVKNCYRGGMKPQKALNAIIGLAHHKGIALHTKPAATGEQRIIEGL